MMKIQNFYTDVPEGHIPEELFQVWVELPHLKLERIISTGHATPPGEWYDQAWAEWVMLLQGQAVLRFADDPEPVHLRPGDYLLIPPHCRHRVEWTDPEHVTLWLAVHFPANSFHPKNT
ncbi:MAG: cupin domain-containing protein [Gemmatimonadetes bacterium]|nr:MAG: cupin domain-containing protein [Gemmatimonadota bacterium]